MAKYGIFHLWSGMQNYLFSIRTCWTPEMWDLRIGSCLYLLKKNKRAHKGTRAIQTLLFKGTCKYKLCTFKRMIVRNFTFHGVESRLHLERRKLILWRLLGMCSPKTKRGGRFDHKLLGNFKLAWSNARRMEFAGRSVSQKCINLTYLEKIELFRASHNTVTLCSWPVLSRPKDA